MFLSKNKQHTFNCFMFLLTSILCSNAHAFVNLNPETFNYTEDALIPGLNLHNIRVTNEAVEHYYAPTNGNSDSNSSPSEVNSNKQQLLYSYNSTIHQQVKNSIVDIFKGPEPELAKLLETTDLVNIYQSQIANLFGFDKYSVSDAASFLWLQAYLAVNYKKPPFVPEAQIKAVSEQFKVIAVNAKQHKLSNKDKQMYAEVLISQGMLILLGYQDAKKKTITRPRWRILPELHGPR